MCENCKKNKDRKEFIDFLDEIIEVIEKKLGIENMQEKVDLVTNDLVDSFEKHGVKVHEGEILLKIITQNYIDTYEKVESLIEEEKNE